MTAVFFVFSVTGTTFVRAWTQASADLSRVTLDDVADPHVAVILETPCHILCGTAFPFTSSLKRLASTDLPSCPTDVCVATSGGTLGPFHGCRRLTRNPETWPTLEILNTSRIGVAQQGLAAWSAPASPEIAYSRHPPDIDDVVVADGFELPCAWRLRLPLGADVEPIEGGMKPSAKVSRIPRAADASMQDPRRDLSVPEFSTRSQNRFQRALHVGLGTSAGIIGGPRFQATSLLERGRGIRKCWRRRLALLVGAVARQWPGRASFSTRRGGRRMQRPVSPRTRPARRHRIRRWLTLIGDSARTRPISAPDHTIRRQAQRSELPPARSRPGPRPRSRCFATVASATCRMVLRSSSSACRHHLRSLSRLCLVLAETSTSPTSPQAIRRNSC